MAVFITSAQEGYGFGRIGLFVCLFACLVSWITYDPFTRDVSRTKEQSITIWG